MTSVHAIRWIKNLENSGHELYWYDILKRGKIDVSEEVNQLFSNDVRKIKSIRGEYTFSRNYAKLYSFIRPLLEVTENQTLDKIISRINPDVVHSFEMQACSYPILKTMNKHDAIPWIYSCWGSDLYYFQNFKEHKLKIANVLARVNFLQTDCERDKQLAKELGYLGSYLPIIPGGGGFDIATLRQLQMPISKRKTILVKGYQHKFGRAINVVQALSDNLPSLNNYNIIIFGAHRSIVDFVSNNNLPFKVYDRDQLTHNEILALMGESLIYVGNSISDGLPNTLLEAIVMGAFPIQSNPGNATEEIISDGFNGLLIHDAEDVNQIASLILKAIADKDWLEKAQILNRKIALSRLDLKINEQKILQVYKTVENSFRCE